MESIKEYLLSITAAAIICSIIVGLIEKKGANSTIIRMLCGLFLAVTVVSPWVNIQLNDLSGYWEGLGLAAENAIDEGVVMANKATADIIKTKSEAYILDKASLWELSIEVEVTVSDSDPPSPYQVRIRGTVSPYAKTRLQEVIAKDLGIPEDRQIWT